MRNNTPIDLQDLLERVSGNTEFAVMMLEMFFKTSQERINQMKTELQERKYEELADSAHKMKGVVGNLAIPLTFNQLSDLHKVARLNNQQEAARLIREIEKSVEDAYRFYLAYPLVS